MKASEEFRAAIRAGKLTDALVIAMTRAVELKVTTWVVAPGDPVDESSKETLARPGHRLHTRINLIQGDLENEVGDQFIGFGPYRDLTSFHQAFIAEGNQIVQDNLKSLQQLFQVLIDLDRKDLELEDWSIDSSGGDYQEFPGGYDEPAGDYQEFPGGYGEPTGDYQESPESYGEPTGDYQEFPGGYGEPTGDYQESPEGYGEPAGDYQEFPEGYDVPAGDYQESPEGYGEPTGDYQEFPDSGSQSTEFEPLPPPPDLSEFETETGTESYDPDFGVDIGLEEDEFEEEFDDPISDVLETFSKEPSGEISSDSDSTASPVPELPVSELEVEDWENSPTEIETSPADPILSLEDLDLDDSEEEEEQWNEWDEPTAEGLREADTLNEEQTNPFSNPQQEEWDDWDAESSETESPSTFVSEAEEWGEWTVEEPETTSAIPNLDSLDLEDDADWVNFEEEEASPSSTTSPITSSQEEVIQDWDDFSEEELDVSYTEPSGEISESANPFLADSQTQNLPTQEVSEEEIFEDLDPDENWGFDDEDSFKDLYESQDSDPKKNS